MGNIKRILSIFAAILAILALALYTAAAPSPVASVAQGALPLTVDEDNGDVNVPGDLHVDGSAIIGTNTIIINSTTDTITATSGNISFDDENLILRGDIIFNAINASNATNQIARLGVFGNTTFQIDTGNPAQTFVMTAASAVSSGGDIGIGTTSPAQALHIVKQIAEVLIEGTGAANRATLALLTTTNISDNNLGFGGNDLRIGLISSPTQSGVSPEFMRLKTNGFVGINTTSPAATLHVVGNTLITGNLVVSGNITPSGNVSLGSWNISNTSTNFQTASDGFVVVTVAISGSDKQNSKLRAEGFTDSSSTPTTLRAGATAFFDADIESFTMPVRKNDYWRVDVTASSGGATKTTTVQFIPLG